MKYLLFFATTFCFLQGFSQDNSADSVYIKNVESQGLKMAALLLDKNYPEFINYTYPPVVKMSGGREKMISALKQSLEEMKKQGMFITNCSVEKPLRIIRAKNELQCTLTEIIEMKIPNGKVTANSTLIAISNDHGKTWTFIDTHGKPLKALQTTVPNLSNDLKIPPPLPPQFFKD